MPKKRGERSKPPVTGEWITGLRRETMQNYRQK